jgi:hypothetical protein
MNRYYNLAFLLIFTSSFSFGQLNSFGLEAGATLSFSAKSALQQYDPYIGITSGINYQHYFEKFHLKTAIAFEQKAYADNGTFTDEVGNILEEYRLLIMNNYISISQFAGIEYGDRLYGFTNIGVVGYVYTTTRQTHNSETFGQIYASPSVYDNGRTIDVAASIETGVGFKVMESLRLYLIGAYNHGFLDQWQDNFVNANEYKWKNRTATLRIGLQFDF